MNVKTECFDNTLKAYLSGEIDHHTAAGIREKIDCELESKRPNLLILDFLNVTFMDSSAVGLIMGRYRIMKNFNGNIEVENLSEQNYKMMKIAGMQSLCSLRKRDENEKN